MKKRDKIFFKKKKKFTIPIRCHCQRWRNDLLWYDSNILQCDFIHSLQEMLHRQPARSKPVITTNYTNILRSQDQYSAESRYILILGNNYHHCSVCHKTHSKTFRKQLKPLLYFNYQSWDNWLSKLSSYKIFRSRSSPVFRHLNS